MADKKFAKQTVHDELPKPEKSEAPSEYLARTGVTGQMQEVISLMLENRPDDPIAFIADYFANITEHTASVTQAYQCLRLSHHNKTAFKNNLFKAYSLLNQQKCGHRFRGLTGKTYNELLTMLCSDITSNESDNLLKLLCMREQEVVGFTVFNFGVTCCSVFKDFLGQTQSLFQELDLSGRGLASHCLCLAVLSQLTKTVSHSRSTSLSLLEAGVSLSSKNVDMAMKKALADSFSRSTGKTMTVEEFVHEASKIFFTKVPAVDKC